MRLLLSTALLMCALNSFIVRILQHIAACVLNERVDNSGAGYVCVQLYYGRPPLALHVRLAMQIGLCGLLLAVESVTPPSNADFPLTAALLDPAR